MKPLPGIIGLVIASAGISVQAQPVNSNAHSAAVAEGETTASAARMQILEVDIKGMSCMACVASVKKTLTGIRGVNNAEITLAPGSARVTTSDSRVTTATVVEAVNKLGYKAAPKAPGK